MVHCGIAEAGSRVSTGQPIVETYADRETWAERVVELGGEIDDGEVPDEQPEE